MRVASTVIVSHLFLGPQDIKHIGNHEERRCVRHSESGEQCNLPDLDAFGAGFSCTSLSSLNGEAGQNTTAISEHKAIWLQCAMCISEKNSLHFVSPRLWHPLRHSMAVLKLLERLHHHSSYLRMFPVSMLHRQKRYQGSGLRIKIK